MLQRFFGMIAGSPWGLWLDRGSPLSRILIRFRWSAPLIVASGIVTGGLEGVGIVLLAPLLASLGGTSGKAGDPTSHVLIAADVFGEQNRLPTLIAAIVSVLLVKAVAQAASGSFAARIDTQIGHEIRSALSDRLLTMDYPSFLDADPGRLVTIISTESWRVTDAVRLSFTTLTAATALPVFGVLMGVISFPLLAGVAVGSTLVRLFQLKLVRHVHTLSHRLTATNAELANGMLRLIEATRLIRLFGQEAREHRSFCKASDTVRRTLFETERATATIAPTVEVVQAALFTTILITAATLGIALPTVLAFLLLLYRAEPHLRTLSHSRLAFAPLQDAISEVEWLLSSVRECSPAPAPHVPASFSGSIRFESVTFSYPARAGQPAALHDMSFTLRQGVSTALIGRSGSGKTTIIHLLSRLLVPTAGRIKIGEDNLADIDVAAWRRTIAVAGQDLELIAGTVAQNICYGAPDASRAEIERAAGLADAADFIRSLPDGYDTEVGAKGLALSGGQRQRIGIARAILRKPRFLVLDEATNAVDGASESAILESLKQHLGDVTIIVISHHVAALAACDDAILLENGRVAQVGSASAPWVRDRSAAAEHETAGRAI